MINEALKRHPAFDGYSPGPYPAVNQCPFLITMSVRAPCTLGSFGVEILNAAGYPIIPRKPDARVILPLAREHLRRRGVKIIVLDEVHALTRSKNQIELAKLQDLFRSLLNDLVQPSPITFCRY